MPRTKEDGIGLLCREAKSLGQQFVESDEWKSKATTQQPTTIMLEMKDILNSGQIATGVSRSVLVPEQQSGMVLPQMIDLRIRSLIPAGSTVSNSIRSIVETGFTNAAAVVPEGGLKPKSELTFGEEIVPVERSRTVSAYPWRFWTTRR